jgi:hypothetical protein
MEPTVFTLGAQAVGPLGVSNRPWRKYVGSYTVWTFLNGQNSRKRIYSRFRSRDMDLVRRGVVCERSGDMDIGTMTFSNVWKGGFDRVVLSFMWVRIPYLK